MREGPHNQRLGQLRSGCSLYRVLNLAICEQFDARPSLTTILSSALFKTLQKMVTLPNLQTATFTKVPIKLNEIGWTSSVPSKPGWYAIETNAPVALLKTLIRNPENKSHYDFSKRVNAAEFLQSCGAIISPRSEGLPYIIYFGEAKSLKARAREHSQGHKKTACLGLSNYAELGTYECSFLFRTCDVHIEGACGDKLLRTLLEQRWRGENGWPILCSR